MKRIMRHLWKMQKDTGSFKIHQGWPSAATATKISPKNRLPAIYFTFLNLSLIMTTTFIFSLFLHNLLGHKWPEILHKFHIPEKQKLTVT